tara:strand:- start:132 stop:1949 length:1818 start_codon:yes stop_codon:yes gene_type:complete
MNIYLRILKFAKPYYLYIFISLITSFCYVITNGLSLWIVGSLLTSVMTEGSLVNDSFDSSFTNQINQFLFGYIDFNDKVKLLKLLSYSLLVSFLLKNIFFYINNISLSYAQNSIIYDIRNKVFTKYQNMSYKFFKNKKSSELTSILMNDVGVLKTTFHHTVQNLFNQPLNVLFFFITLLFINFKLTIICLIIIPISAFITIQLSSSIRRKAMRSTKLLAALMNVIIENIQNIKIIKSFTNQEHQINKFKKKGSDLFDKDFRLEKLYFLNTPVLDMIGAIIGAVLLWIGGKAVLIDGNMSSDGFIKFFTFLFAMFQPAKKIAGVSVEINKGIASAQRVFNVLDDQQIELYNNKDKIGIDNFKNTLEFNNVIFSYNGRQNVLDNINININKGDFIALVGESGSGKTTFIDLILNFYKVNSGSINIDGININDININSLRKKFGLVSQDNFLFNDTIYNNIRFGDLNARDEKIYDAAKRANAFDFINQFPDKFKTLVGENGAKLSGGQKQRIAIARTILKNPDILIFDEATSALDSKSESKIQESVQQLSKDKTVIVIAHRLSTIKDANKILFFENGTITGQGSHPQLYKSNKEYKNIYDLQFGGIDE